MFRRIVTLLFLVFSTYLSLTQTTVRGVINDEKGDAIPYATVRIVELQKATYSNELGEYEFKSVPVGNYQLLVTSIGYKNQMNSFVINEDQEELVLKNLQLLTDLNQLDEVVVTGTLKPTYVKDSPVKTDVITSKFLRENTSPANLAESVFLINGVQEVVGCGVCYTNSVSINGLPGPNTAILLDGMPIYGNLASVYGLNSIPNSVIDRIEVIKGPSSTLYGSEATAGVINVITKSPKNSDRFTAEIKTTQHLETYTNAAYTFNTKKVDVMLGGNYTRLANFNDNNKDRFSDVVHLDQYGVFSKLSFNRKSNKRLDLAFKYYYEDRRNGIDDYVRGRKYRDIRGNDSIYGESIYTNRFELIGSYELPTRPSLRLDYSLSSHRQNSFYGSDSFNADQKILFANLIYNKVINKHDVIFGLTNRYQLYDDNTFATNDSILNKNDPEKQYIPGVFIQDQWLLGKGWTLLSGGRLDHYNKHGVIFSPRLNIKKKVGKWTNIRLNTGTGFRVVNVFTEDHVVLSRGDQVIFEEDLKPEKSYNATLSMNHIYSLGKSQGVIGLDFFYTYFSNRIIGDYSGSDVTYRNLDGYSISRGINFNFTNKSTSSFSYSLGGTLLSAFKKDDENNEGKKVKEPIPFSGTWNLLNTLNYRFKKSKLLIALTTKVVGPMNLNIELPVDDQRPDKSEAFLFQTLQLTKTISNQFEFYVGIQNLWNYTQRSPLYGTKDNGTDSFGFREDFNTDYAYGPLEGREIYFGLRLTIN